MEDEKYITVDEAAQYLGYKRQTIYNKVHNKEIPFHRLGPKTIRFKKSELDIWAKPKEQSEIKYINENGIYFYSFTGDSYGIEITDEETFLKEAKREIEDSWNYINKKSDRPFSKLFFDEDIHETAKEVIKANIVYPTAIKNNAYLYEHIDINFLNAVLTIFKYFENRMNIGLLKELKERIKSNIINTVLLPDSDLSEGNDEAYIGYRVEWICRDIFYVIQSIVICFENGFVPGEITQTEAQVYQNRYFDKETFLDLYMSDFCYFAQHPFRGDVDKYILKDRTIDEMSPEQIKKGLEVSLFIIGDIKGELKQKAKRLEEESKDILQILK